MTGTPTVRAPEPPPTRLSRFASAFTPPPLPPVSRRAFRFHMGYVLLDAVSAGILSNAPLMAVKAMQATDVQLQLPIVMTSIGLFVSVFSGVAMAARQKKPFVLLPGIASAVSALFMAWTSSATWFVFAAGLISIFDFAIRPAVPSILRIIYPDYCRSHVAGTLRQYASIVFLGASLLFATLLSAGIFEIRHMIEAELTLAGLASLAGFACFRRLPDRGDGNIEEASPERFDAGSRSFREQLHAIMTPLRDRRFRRFLPVFFLYCCGNLFYLGIVPAFFARDLGFGYVQATLLIHVVPALTGFLAGGRLTAWFDRTSIWRSYSMVALLWGLDPLLLALAPFVWPALLAARISRGPATVGSMVLAVYTGVHRFARPGRDTSCYMSALFFVNGLARLFAPTATALVSGHISHRMILFCGALGVLSASALFLRIDRAERARDSRFELLASDL